MFTLHVFSCVELLMISAGWHISTVVSCILWQRPALVRERAFCLWVLKLKASERGCKQWHPQGQTGLYNAVMSGCTGPLHSTAHSLVRDPFWDYTTHTHTHTRALMSHRSPSEGPSSPHTRSRCVSSGPLGWLLHRNIPGCYWPRLNPHRITSKKLGCNNVCPIV